MSSPNPIRAFLSGSIVQKLYLRVGLLIVITLVVVSLAIYEFGQFNDQVTRLVDQTAKGLDSARILRRTLLESVLAEKGVVLSDDDAEAQNYKTMALDKRQEIQTSRAELLRALEEGKYTEEKRTLDEFDRQLDIFYREQDKVLAWGVQNTNYKAWKLWDTELAERVNQLDRLLAEIESDNETKSGPIPRLVTASQKELEKLTIALIRHIRANDEADMKQMDALVGSILDRLRSNLKALKPALTAERKADWTIAQDTFEKLALTVAQMQKLSHINSDNFANLGSVGPVRQARLACDKLLVDITNGMLFQLQKERESAQNAFRNSKTILLWAAGITLVVGVLGAWLTQRAIVTPVSQTVKGLKQMTGIGLKLKTLAQDLMSHSEETTNQAGSVAAATEELNRAIQTVAGTAEQVSVNIAGISSASEEIAVNLNAITHEAEATSSSVNAVRESVDSIHKGLTSVSTEAKDGYQQAAEAMALAEKASATMASLHRSAHEITQVTGVIQSIALQTNLLALNASIEATAAGDAGKGFGVVAAEIKGLAQQSGQSASEIARRMAETQQSVDEAVSAMRQMHAAFVALNSASGRINQSVEMQKAAAESIARSASQANNAAAKIANSIREVGKGTSDMAKNTSEAAKGSADVSSNTTQAASAASSIASSIHAVSEASHLNANSATSLNASALELAELCKTLEDSVNNLGIE